MGLTYDVIVADDHEIVRCGVRFILEPNHKYSIKAEASSFGQLIEVLASESCDILILDLNMGDQNGVQTVRTISDLYPQLKILVLSMFPEDPYAIKSIHAGASGYLSKKILIKELEYAMEIVTKGEVYLSDSYSSTLPYGMSLTKSKIRPIHSLSSREQEVYQMIVSGISNKAISQTLNLSPKTISTYRTRILEKLSLSNINQLIHFALQNELGEKQP